MALVDDIWLATLGEYIPGQRPEPLGDLAGKAIDPMSRLIFFAVMNASLKQLPERAAEEVLMHRASVARGGYGNLPEESLYPAMVFDPQAIYWMARTVTDYILQPV
jgi:hypothetical protein